MAVVESKPISKAELETAFGKAVAAAGKSAADFSDAEKQAGYHSILNEMIIERLLLKRSEKEVVSDAEVESDLAKFRKQLGSQEKLEEAIKKEGQTVETVKASIRDSLKEQKWIDSQIAGKTSVAESDAKEFYEKNPDKFKAPEMVRASHILIAVPKDAKPDQVAEKQKQMATVAERIKKGEAFEKVAAEVSEDPGSKNSGGDLNFFPRGSMVPEFEQAAFTLGKGEVSQPVKSDFGIHLIKVTDKKEAHTVGFDEAKERIMSYLQDQKRRIVVSSLINEMRSKADVKVNLPVAEKNGPVVDRSVRSHQGFATRFAFIFFFQTER